MSIWFALLESYDIRSTFDEMIIWIWLRYRYVHLRSKLSLFLQTKKRCYGQVSNSALTTYETSRNNNIQLSNTFQLCLCTYSICLYYYYNYDDIQIQSACIMIV